MALFSKEPREPQPPRVSILRAYMQSCEWIARLPIDIRERRLQRAGQQIVVMAREVLNADAEGRVFPLKSGNLLSVEPAARNTISLAYLRHGHVRNIHEDFSTQKVGAELLKINLSTHYPRGYRIQSPQGISQREEVRMLTEVAEEIPLVKKSLHVPVEEWQIPIGSELRCEIFEITDEADRDNL